MILNLKEKTLYESEELKIEKKYTFIFGKNGTGKSTVTDIINTQCEKTHDVRIFNGFDDVVDEENHLNAVVLGKENNKIKKKIENLESEIKEYETLKKEIEKNYTAPEEGDYSPNLFTELDALLNEQKSFEKNLESCLKKEAAKIKAMENPRFVRLSYNVADFKQDINKAAYLSNDEMINVMNILKSDIKIVDKISVPLFDLSDCIKKTNIILKKYVKEKIHLERIGTNPNRVEFAKKGLALHKPGGICIFCGNVITENAYEEVKTYFSADEVKAFQKEIEIQINFLKEMAEDIEKVKFDCNLFYPIYEKEVSNLNDKLIEYRNSANKIISKLIDELEKKKSSLFVSRDEILFDFSDSYYELCKKYNEIVEKNNTNNLKRQQEIARKKLLAGVVYNALDRINYTKSIIEKNRIDNAINEKEKQIIREREKVSGPGGFEEKIDAKKKMIEFLKKQTCDERKLAQDISAKLKSLVSFELEYIPPKENQLKGLYKIKDSNTLEIRNVTELSTGEKNIIAFLYFIGKLNEVNEDNDRMPQLIVFDDPMNSNDDNMQYLMLGELDHLMKNILESDTKFVLLTHNIHFYVNINYKRRKDKDADFIHLEKLDSCIAFHYVDGKSDFKTSYESLWDELKFLYLNEGAGPDLLLNPARRIFETYIKFNGLDSNIFYKNHIAEKKLFDVNSHSIDDLNADLNSNTKEQIIEMVKGCFEDNNAKNHFEVYWNEN